MATINRIFCRSYCHFYSRSRTDCWCSGITFPSAFTLTSRTLVAPTAAEVGSKDTTIGSNTIPISGVTYTAALSANGLTGNHVLDCAVTASTSTLVTGSTTMIHTNNTQDVSFREMLSIVMFVLD